MAYWLVKSEPSVYSWDTFVSEGETFWSGVRNYEARNNLRAMKKGEKVLYYHSNEGKEIVGLAQVSKEAYQDPTSDDANWVAVDLKPVKALKHPVSLAALKADPRMANLGLVRKGRISVTAVTEQEYKDIMELAGEKTK
jgi:predicted RNA-binding protein with PUA-like domain